MKISFFKYLIISFFTIGLFFSTPVVFAATTIGTNISTGGSLTADGALKFTSGAGTNFILTTDASGNATWISVGNALSAAGLGVGDPGGIAPLDGSSLVPLANLPVGIPGGIATLDGIGKVPLAQLPSITITNTYVVGSQAAMLALPDDIGSIAIRTDENKTYILAALPATTLSNWLEIVTPLDTVLKIANNLSDLADAGIARTNIGLGTTSSPTITGLTLTSGALGINGLSYLFPSVAGTLGQVLVNDGSGNLTWTNQSSGFADPMTTIGDMIYRNLSNTTARLPVGTPGQVLTASGTVPVWASPSSGFSDPMTTRGDIIYRDPSNTTNRLALGSNGQILTSDGTDLVWGAATSSGVTSVFGRTGVVVASSTDYTTFDALTINNSLTIPSYTDFTSTSNPLYAQGRLFYDFTEKSLAYYNDHSGITMNLGQENMVRVYNDTGSTILNSKAVYVSGTFGDLPTVALARADDENTNNVLGLATEDIPNGSTGYITTTGLIHDLNTSSFNEGDNFYLSAVTAGDITTTRPTIPAFTVPLGSIVKKDASTGILLIHSVAHNQIGALTIGSVPFANANGDLNEDNTNLFWNNTTKRLGIGDNTPAKTLTIGNGTPGSNKFNVDGSTGDVLTQGDITLSTGGGSITSTGGVLNLNTTGTASTSIGNGTGGVALTLGSDATGDVYYRNSGGLLNRLPIGLVNQVLTVASGLPSWATTSSGFANPMTTLGDVIYGGASGVATRLPIGTNSQILTIAGGVPTWAAASAGFSDPMTTRGDIIYRDPSNTTNRLALGSNGQILTSDGTDLVWGAASAGSVSSVFGRTGVVVASSSDYTTFNALTINNSLTIPNYADFTTTSNPAYAEGRLFWDDTLKSLSYYGDISGLQMNLGRQLWFRVKNTTGVTIDGGKAVYVTGNDGLFAEVALAKADDLITSRVIGVTVASIANGAYGYAMSKGIIPNLDTSLFSSGDTVFLSSATAGDLTSTKPSAPNYSVFIGTIQRGHPTTGSILANVSHIDTGSLTAGSLAFGGTDGFTIQDNTNLFWNNTTKRLGIGDNTPGATLTIGNGTPGSSFFQVFGSSGNVTTQGDITLSTGGGSITSTGGVLNLNTTGTASTSIGNGTGGVALTLGSDATGDVYYRNSGGNLSRLGVGSNGNVLTLAGGVPSWASAAGGTVTSFSSGNLSPLFTTSVTSTTTTPALSFSLSNAAAFTILGNNTGSSATPTYFAPILASALFANQGSTTSVLHGNASGNPSWSAITLTTDVTGTLNIANGGTGAITAGTARTNLSAAASGANSDITSLSGLTSPLSILQGGTGATTSALAFSNLSPLTTKGDILVFGTANTRLAVGSNGQVLTASSTAATGLAWTTGISLNTLTMSSTTGSGVIMTFTAGGTIDAGDAVTFNASGLIIRSSANGVAIGVAQATTTSGNPINVLILGVSIVDCVSATAGGALESAGSGDVENQSGNAPVIGTAITSCVGNQATVFIQPTNN